MSSSTIGAGNAVSGAPAGAIGIYSASGFSRNNGLTYACVSSDYVGYTSSSNAYLITKEFVVPQGQSLKVTLTSRRKNSSAGAIDIFYNISGSCSFSTTNNYNNGWIEWGSITPAISVATPGGCTEQSTATLTNEICGGQIVSVCFYCPNASSTNWIVIENIKITAEPNTTAVPVITGAVVYNESFNVSDYWYAPIAQTYPKSRNTNAVMMPYHSLKTSSSTYASLWTGGAGSTLWHTGSTGYYCQLPYGSEYCDNTGGTQIFTKEVNTSGCPNAMLRFDFRSWYPSSGDYGYTFDENYQTYCPEVYYSIGTPTGSIGSYSYNWVQIPVNYYFATGKWMRAAYALPSANNVKIKIAGKSFTYNNYIDNIQVACEDCRISTQTGANPVGETNPAPNTEYTYTVAATPFATYYRWIIRKKELGGLNPEATLYWDAYNPSTPDIPGVVSGQGTQTAIINFGSCTDCDYRVMCLPYDGTPGAITVPNELCYASIGILDVVTLPINLSSFNAVCINDSVHLAWTTTTEINNHFFSILRSVDFEKWESIATIQGAGSSNQLLKYDYTDTNPLGGTSYYMLKQTDFDGHSETFEPLSVRCGKEITTAQVTLSPNPFQSVLNAEFTNLNCEMILIRIFDVTGRIVYEDKNHCAGQRTLMVTLDLNSLPSGVYSANFLLDELTIIERIVKDF